MLPCGIERGSVGIGLSGCDVADTGMCLCVWVVMVNEDRE
jgi:hypothetical protein